MQADHPYSPGYHVGADHPYGRDGMACSQVCLCRHQDLKINDASVGPGSPAKISDASVGPDSAASVTARPAVVVILFAGLEGCSIIMS